MHYLKPVGTGGLEQGGDDGFIPSCVISMIADLDICRHVKRFGSLRGHELRTDCLFRFKTPVSPHLAVSKYGDSSDAVPLLHFGLGLFLIIGIQPPTDEEFVAAIQQHMDGIAQSDVENSSLYIETAGGPSNLQAEIRLIWNRRTQSHAQR